MNGEVACSLPFERDKEMQVDHQERKEDGEELGRWELTDQTV